MTLYSHSRIETYKTCPKKYEFSYVRRLPKTSRGIEAYMGSCVHKVLESLYDDVLMGLVPTVSEVLDRYREVWEREWDSSIRVVREGRTPEDYRSAGEHAIRIFYQRHHPFERGTTVGLEQRVVLELEEGGLRLQGYVDRLVKVSDGVWEIHDYKTSRRLPTQADVDADRQLAIYQLAVEEMHPEARDVTLVWHYLLHDHEMRSHRTPEELEEVRKEVVADIRQIEAAEDFPTHVGTLCDWCEYRDVCPAWADEVRVEGLAESSLTEDPDVELVDRYVSVTDRLRELAKEKETLREEILRRGEDRGLEALAGTEQRVRLSRSTTVRIPAAGTPEREELENVLKETGSLSRLSMLDARALAGVLAEGSIPSEVRQRIEPYVTMDETVTIRCSRR